MARRQAPTVVTFSFDDVGDIDDDIEEEDSTHADCPICKASREGRPVNFEGVNESRYLIKEARRALRRVKLAPDEEVTFVESGRMLPNETYEIISYTIDATGCIYKTRNGTRSVVMRIPIA